LTATAWEHRRDVREALQTIVSDPQLGAAALSNAQTMSNLLKDLLPDAPRETSVLVAAAEAGLAQILLDHVRQGMDAATAASLAASAFAARAPFTPEACHWVVGELSVALGIVPGLFSTAADYRAGLAELNLLTGFDARPAGRGCPPPSGSTSGQSLWHSNDKANFGPRAGQIVECYPYSRGSSPIYLWTLPTQRVILIASDQAARATYTNLGNWWSRLSYG